jgi:hypothetical protein
MALSEPVGVDVPVAFARHLTCDKGRLVAELVLRTGLVVGDLWPTS